MTLTVVVLAVCVALGLLVLSGQVRRLRTKLDQMEETQRQRFQVVVQALQRLEAFAARIPAQQAASQEADPRAATSAVPTPGRQAPSRQWADRSVAPLPPVPSAEEVRPPRVAVPVPVPPSPGPSEPPASGPAGRPAASARQAVLPPFRPPLPPPHRPNRFESAARDVLRRVWNWITVGDQRGVADASYEFALATHWLVRIGVVILVLGIGFFLRYSIQQRWISEAARVVLAATAGMIMISGGVALLGRRYHLLAQGLLGGGVAVLYFSVYAAANFYQLLSAVPTAFALMVAVALLAGVMAVMYDSLLMAALGLLLGLLTPVVLHTGTIHYVGLNTYLLALGAGVILISLWKDWPVLYLLAFHGVYALVLFSLRGYRPEHYLEVFPFLVGLFALFSTLAVVRHLCLKLPSNLLDVAILLGNFAVLFFVGSWLTYGWLEYIGRSTRYSALLPLGIMFYYAAQAGYLLYARIRDTGLWASSTALASLAAAVVPVLALGDLWTDWLMPSWAFLGTAVLWLGLRLRSRLLPQLGTLFLAGALVLFVLLDVPMRANVSLSPNVTWRAYLLEAADRLAPSLLTVLALAGAAWIVKHPPIPAATDRERHGDLPALGSAWGWFVLVLGMLLFVLGWEADRATRLFAPLARPLGLTVVWTVLAAVLLVAAGNRSREQRLMWIAAAVVPLALKWLLVDLRHWGFGPEFAFTRGVSPLGTALRMLDFALVGGVLLLAGRVSSEEERARFAHPAGYALAALAALWFSLTLETSTWLHHRLQGFQAGGVSILWAVFALALLLAGILRRAPAVRWLGLGLFAVVAVKVFLVDLRHLDAFYRIVAFVVLGLLVLAGSWLYMRHSERFRKSEVFPAAPSPDEPENATRDLPQSG